MTSSSRTLPPGWMINYLSLEPRDLPPDVLEVVNTFFYDVGVDTARKDKKEKVQLLSDIHKTEEVWLVLSSDKKQRQVIGWSKEGPTLVNIFWGKFADDQISVCVAGGSEGVRITPGDQAKRLDGCGPCGRAFCCSTWLKDFHPVTLKMAREQQLSLNPGKISGACGRLLCCLAYELTLYRENQKALPPPGTSWLSCPASGMGS